MKVAYFDCFSGVSGDMILGALIDAGLDPETLKKAHTGLSLSGYEISVKKIVKNGITATRFNVMVSGHQYGRHLSDILDIINVSSLNDRVKQSAADIFRKIGRAEAGIHNVDIEKILRINVLINASIVILPNIITLPRFNGHCKNVKRPMQCRRKECLMRIQK